MWGIIDTILSPLCQNSGTCVTFKHLANDATPQPPSKDLLPSRVHFDFGCFISRRPPKTLGHRPAGASTTSQFHQRPHQFHPFERESRSCNGRGNTTETNWNRPLILAAYGHGNFNRNNFVDSWPWLQPFNPHVVRVGVSECSGEASPSHILNDENPWKRGPEFDVAEPPNTMILVTVFKDWTKLFTTDWWCKLCTSHHQLCINAAHLNWKDSRYTVPQIC